MTENLPGFRLTEIPEPGPGLSDGAKQEWQRLIAIIYRIGSARGADLRAFELLCELLADIRSLEDAIRREGFTIEAGSGGRKGHPALSSLAAARRHAEQLMGKFCLLPTGRKATQYSEFHHGSQS